MSIVAIIGQINNSHLTAVRRASAASPNDDLTIVVDSNGGDLAVAFPIADAIRRHRGVTIARVHKRADSAAILVVAACRVRIARSTARFAMHVTERTFAGRMTAAEFRREAARLDRLDQRCRERIASYIDCTVAELADLERAQTTLAGREALNLRLVNELSDCPALSARARRHRIARITARAPITWTRREMQAVARAGMLSKPITIAPTALRSMLAERT